MKHYRWATPHCREPKDPKATSSWDIVTCPLCLKSRPTHDADGHLIDWGRR